MVYLLIKGPSYRGLDFDAREKVREGLRKQLETHGIRFVEYGWVWDEEDRCLLVVGQYAHPDDASLATCAARRNGSVGSLNLSCLKDKEAWISRYCGGQ